MSNVGRCYTIRVQEANWIILQSHSVCSSLLKFNWSDYIYIVEGFKGFIRKSQCV